MCVRQRRLRLCKDRANNRVLQDGEKGKPCMDFKFHSWALGREIARVEIRRLLYLVDDLDYVAFMSWGGEAREGAEDKEQILDSQVQSQRLRLYEWQRHVQRIWFGCESQHFIHKLLHVSHGIGNVTPLLIVGVGWTASDQSQVGFLRPTRKIKLLCKATVLMTHNACLEKRHFPTDMLTSYYVLLKLRFHCSKWMLGGFWPMASAALIIKWINDSLWIARH